MSTILAVKDAGEMGRAAADLFARTVRRKPGLLVTLPSGFTPLPFYKELAARYQAGEKDLNRFTYMALDEYIGRPSGDRRLFSSWLAREILDPLELPSDRRLTFNSQAADPAKEAQRVDRLIEKCGGIDLAVLGLGVNGHIGFNEPDSPFDSGVRVVTLTEETRKTNAVYWDNDTDVPPQAYTLGLTTLKQAKQVVLLVSGQKKAEILRASLKETPSPFIPATCLQDHPHLTVIADQAALSALPAS